MRRTFAVILLCCSFVFAKASHSSAGHSSGQSHTSASKSVHVRGYTRKDGTYVQPYNRRLPGTAVPYSHLNNGTSGTVHRYRPGYLAEGYQFHSTVRRDRNGRIKRSAGAKHSFEREHPCPSTGKTGGGCPGYVVDHVKPLECGGADAPSNMQWQTASQGKAKDKTERYCRM